MHWSLTGPVYLTRRKTLAVRDEIQMGAWNAAYMFDDYTIVYHRVWDYGGLESQADAGGYQAECKQHFLLEVRGDHAFWDALALWVCASDLLPELRSQCGRGRLRAQPHVPGSVFNPKRIASDVVGVLDLLLDGVRLEDDGAEWHQVATLP